jgi:4-amino-4-deoxy-L-arabinose transferase-like glycosyltransferase
VSAWVTIGATLGFIALTCWWLTQDRSIPIYDAGDHLQVALYFHQLLASGDLLGPLKFTWQYPPLGELVGALAASVGGVNVAAPIIGENVLFVSLLSLGCYQTGRLLFDARAGTLASIFALGSPLLIAQFHVFMLDAPEAALVSIAMWLILASEDFSARKFTVFAALACGAGVLIKVQFPFFIIGLLLAAVLHGGWRRRGQLELFALLTLLVGAPWYIFHRSEFSTIFSLAGSGSEVINDLKVAGASSAAISGTLPPTWSIRNFTWYFWSALNSELYLFLFAFLMVGALWMLIIQLRHARRPVAFTGAHPQGDDSRRRVAQLELLCGAFVAWLGITLTPHHDIRYGMGLLPYLAVIATGWIVSLPRAPRVAASIAIVLAVLANTLSTTFGLGGTVVLALAHPLSVSQAQPDRITLYSSNGYLVAGPRRDGDLEGVLKSLRRSGVRGVRLRESEGTRPDFSFEGVVPLDTIAGLSSTIENGFGGTNIASIRFDYTDVSASVVALIHRAITSASPPACTRLSDQTGVWVARRNPRTHSVMLYCPSLTPAYYGSVARYGEPLH